MSSCTAHIESRLPQVKVVMCHVADLTWAVMCIDIYHIYLYIHINGSFLKLVHAKVLQSYMHTSLIVHISTDASSEARNVGDPKVYISFPIFPPSAPNARQANVATGHMASKSPSWFRFFAAQEVEACNRWKQR